MTDTKTPQLRKIEQLGEDSWLNKYLLTYVLPDGEEYVYESFSRKNLVDYKAELTGEPTAMTAAVFVPILMRERKVVMIREFRYPVNDYVFEFPAGLIEPDEDPLVCAIRELAEETGFVPHVDPDGTYHITALPPALSATGATDEACQIVLAEVDRGGEKRTEGSEFIDIVEVPFSKMYDLATSKDIRIGARAQLILLILHHMYGMLEEEVEFYNR